MKLLIKITVKSLILIIIFSSALFSQQDTITSVRETTSINEQDTTFVSTKSPWLAVLQSAIVPGLGQIYNESYIKAPIIWGGFALLVYGWFYNDNLYDDYKILYQQENNDSNRRNRNFYRDQRDLFTIYMGLVYLLNLVDAYVDAHLFDFNVEEDFFTRLPMLNLKINF